MRSVNTSIPCTSLTATTLLVANVVPIPLSRTGRG